MSNAPALWTKNRRIAFHVAKEFFAPGHEQQDIEQECLIGLWEAARSHDPAKGKFPPFALLVIRRRLTTFITQANRNKHLVLTEAVRDYDMPVEEETGGQLRLILDLLPTLTELERDALRRSLNGEPITSKSYDNALQRARQKLRAA
jgi:RNA polymerase sigma factor (sigma-70 family)